MKNLHKNLIILMVLILFIGCDSSVKFSEDDANKDDDAKKDIAVPIINSNNITVQENQTTVLTIDATDTDSNLTYSLDGVDKSKFTVSTTGIVTFITAPDYEIPSDSGADNIYDLTLKVKDSSNNESSKDLIITVIDIVDEDAPSVDVVAVTTKTNSAEIIITFNEDMNLTTLLDSSFSLKEGATDAAFSSATTSNKREVTLTTTSSLDANKAYVLTVNQNVQDISNNGISSNYSQNLVTDLNKVVYKEITSPHTNRIWLDRNLGATQVCTSSSDSACYGDYFQWGRKMNGHEKLSSGLTTGLVNDGSTDVITGGKHIWVNSALNDWQTITINTNLWNGVNAPNNPCPVGFKVPDSTEIRIDTIDSNNNGINGESGEVTGYPNAFSSFLKLPAPGVVSTTGSIQLGSVFGVYWASSVNGTNSGKIYFLISTVGTTNDARAFGKSVRCMKDY